MAVEQRKSQVLDLSRPGAVGVEIDVAEAAEVLMSMATILDEDDDTFDLGAEAIAAARAAISPEVARADRAGRVQRREVPGVPARPRLRRPRAADVRGLHGAPACHRAGRPQAAPARLPRHRSPSRLARDDPARRGRRPGGDRGVPGRALRVRPQAGRRQAAARAGGGRRQGGAGRAAAALVRRGVPAALGRVARGRRARRRGQEEARAHALARADGRARDERLPVLARAGQCGRSSSSRAGGCGRG